MHIDIDIDIHGEKKEKRKIQQRRMKRKIKNSAAGGSVVAGPATPLSPVSFYETLILRPYPRSCCI